MDEELFNFNNFYRNKNKIIMKYNFIFISLKKSIKCYNIKDW